MNHLWIIFISHIDMYDIRTGRLKAATVALLVQNSCVVLTCAVITVFLLVSMSLSFWCIVIITIILLFQPVLSSLPIYWWAIDLLLVFNCLLFGLPHLPSDHHLAPWILIMGIKMRDYTDISSWQPVFICLAMLFSIIAGLASIATRFPSLLQLPPGVHHCFNCHQVFIVAQIAIMFPLSPQLAPCLPWPLTMTNNGQCHWPWRHRFPYCAAHKSFKTKTIFDANPKDCT